MFWLTPVTDWAKLPCLQAARSFQAAKKALLHLVVSIQLDIPDFGAECHVRLVHVAWF